MKLRSEVKKAIGYGAICAIAYCTVYISRDTLSALSPQLSEKAIFTTGQLGTLSSLFFITYAVGQLINGIIGDKINGKYMVSFGLIFAGLCLFAMPLLAAVPWLAYTVYSAMGFFLAMVYAPMTKLIAENNEPLLTTRCNVAHSMASYLGAPLAGLFAAWLAWKQAFRLSSTLVIAMGMVFFVVFTVFEKKGMCRYGQYKPKEKGSGNIRVLLERQLLKWTVIAMLTGVVRTAVVFWLPTYLSQHLGFDSTTAPLMYTIGTSFISVNSFLAVFLYDRLKQNLDRTILLFFSVSAICFFGVFAISQPYVNLVLMILAMIFSNCASSLMWSCYCPSLRDTGMVSTATGFLDFCSYTAAAISSKLFAGAVGTIGWGNLILVWCGLMGCGIFTALFKKKNPPAYEWGC